MTLGERIALCRKKAGLSQEELAGRLGLSRQAVSRWETGAALPDIDKIVELSRLFGVTTDFLLLEKQQKPDSPPAVLESPAAPVPDPVVERCRKFRIGFGLACAILGLVTAVTALFLNQYAAENLTQWWTDLGRFGTALRSWRGVLLGFGSGLFLVGGGVLLREYLRKD